MHGLPRRAPTPEESVASVAKAAKLRELQSKVLHNHHNRIYTRDALDASLDLLEINPEVLYGWNYRKSAFQHHLDGAAAAAAADGDANAVGSLVDEELRVAEIALRKNPKSYGAWHHRKWVLRRRLAPVDYDREFRLIEKLLTVDPRNFHGWSYRRFITAMKDVPEEEELQFTMKMIDKNFSNYSAWHNRSELLSRLLKQKAQGYVSKEKILMEEYDLVHQALFTDSGDQSGWFYHLWLLDQTVTPDLLVESSWPLNGSELILSSDGNKGDYIIVSSTHSSSHYSLHTGTFPIILCFNQAVKGVNPSSIEVKSILFENEDLTWRPLTSNNSGEAHCWVTYLNISDTKFSSSDAHSVVVGLGHSKDITSSSGSSYCNPLELKFSIKLNHTDPKQTKQELAPRQLIWDDDSICQPEEGPVISFDQLQIMDSHVSEHSEWHLETLSNEISLFKELPEENCKFAMLTLARLYNAYNVMASHGTLPTQKRVPSGEVLKLLDDLMQLDPSHRRYYEDERSLVLIDQVTSNKESLMKHCYHFDNLVSSNFHHHACLRLNNLSLTRIGFCNRLLWVQILDLSHNMIRSIQGLEALQLLICLNLSNNRLSSFTSLEPLKLLFSLKILNISFNEIGAHPVDTTRYLCSSPLSHTKDIDLGIEYVDDKKVADNWEAIFLFRELHLTQLDIKGNAITGENLRELVTKVMPTLKWLDGECLG